MSNQDLGAVTTAQGLLRLGLADHDVVSELRERHSALDETVARAVVRQARAFAQLDDHVTPHRAGSF